MKVFISWSGPRSHEIALAFRDWLPLVLPFVTPWVSSEDIPKGARWPVELGRELDAARFGIICLVPENLSELWVIFEAGAMSRSIDAARVAPFLVEVDIQDVPGPLAQFQCTAFGKEDVRKLLRSINQTSDTPIHPNDLDQAFERRWSDLAGLIEKVRSRAVVRERVAPAADPRRDLKEPVDLPKEQVAILMLLAKHPDTRPTVKMLAVAIGVDQTRTQYHLDRLKERRFVHDILAIGRAATYYLTDAGRAHVVENNLI